VGSAVAECVGELATQALVLLGQFQVPFEGRFQAREKRSVGCALAGRDRRRRCPAGDVTEALDLRADVGLGIQPGPVPFRNASLRVVVGLVALVGAWDDAP
jgi:hypothetical protein